jgi:hypothetical protein
VIPGDRIRLAELTSGVGAVVLGAGLGVLLAPWLEKLGPLIIFLRVAVHGWGMFDKHRLERRQGASGPQWSTALYWICWLALAAMILWALIRP